ncbi:unnamed protein product [Mytilus coruscus]|uniref:Uncharacterized protein n=1 Tax=Mytilus coruscus TaxID=42192 RepID=A0A6J8BVP0_MYTCO|nr:unnamed protein product [Mytilus coruscus]
MGYHNIHYGVIIKQNGDVERILHKCTSPLPGLYIEIQNVPSNDLSKTSSPLPSATSFSSRLDKTSPPLPNTTFQGQTISTYSASLKSTYLSQLASKSSALKESIGTSIVVQATAFVGFPETTSPDLLEFPSSDVPAKDELGGISAIVIIAIVAAFLIVIVILVTVVLCKRKRKTQVPTSNKPLTMVGKEVVYAHVNKPTVKREKSTSSQKSQPAASDDTYDHMEHCRLSQTHNPAERNYDTMRSIANGGEEENNYDHVTGTKMEPKRFVFDIATNNSHVEVEFHEVNSWSK